MIGYQIVLCMFLVVREQNYKESQTSVPPQQTSAPSISSVAENKDDSSDDEIGPPIPDDFNMVGLYKLVCL